MMTSAELSAELEAQDARERLQPGEEGWWEVWGASVSDVVAGDAVAVKDVDGWMYVQDVYTAKSAPMRAGWVVDGERVTMGMLARVAVMRRGTHNMLAGSVR